MLVSTCTTCIQVSLEARKGHQITWNCSYKWLSAATGMLGTEHWPSIGAASTLNNWAVSPAQELFEGSEMRYIIHTLTALLALREQHKISSNTPLANVIMLVRTMSVQSPVDFTAHFYRDLNCRFLESVLSSGEIRRSEVWPLILYSVCDFGCGNLSGPPFYYLQAEM